MAFLPYVAPFAVWILLQTFLPATAAMYAVRSVAAAIAAFAAWLAVRRTGAGGALLSSPVSAIALGLFVAAFWILPEECPWYRTWVLWPFGAPTSVDAAPSPYDPAVCSWPLVWVKLAGSAFVIAPVEELFFRSFLYRWVVAGSNWRNARLDVWNWNGVLWTAFVFSLEHSPRFAVAFLCAIVYQFAAKRCGIAGAMLAHITTNLVLALYVMATGKWFFW